MRPAGFPLAAAIVLAMAAPSPAEADMRIGLAAPLTGRYSSGGAETQRGAEAAVADLNAGGGVLGEQIEIITADDYCEDEQAVAAVNKVLAAGVVAVLATSARARQYPP